jgi:hypothetical protein
MNALFALAIYILKRHARRTHENNDYSSLSRVGINWPSVMFPKVNIKKMSSNQQC